jgi:hypothetical protein
MAAREFDDPRMDWSSPLGIWIQRLGVINTYMNGMPSDEVVFLKCRGHGAHAQRVELLQRRPDREPLSGALVIHLAA